MNANLPSSRLTVAVEAAMEKKAADIVVLDLRGMGAFTEFFLICTGASAPQIHAIADEIDHRMKEESASRPRREGYQSADWVLLDYGEFVAHIFSPKARQYFDLERLWRTAPRIEVAQPGGDKVATG